MADHESEKLRSAASIVGLVLGILAVILSWVPIINNFAFILGGIGIIFAIVGLVGTLRGKRSGKGLAIASLVVNVVALAVVLGTQSMYSEAIDDAVNGSDVVTSQPSDQTADEVASEGEDASEDAAVQTENLAVGSSVSFEDGLTLTVDSVTPGLANYDGSALVGIHVTYVNNGNSEVDYSSYSWKGQDAQGASTDSVYYSEAAEDLSYGTLAPGGTVSGDVYFEGDSINVLYYSNIFSDGPSASWTIA